MYGHALAQAIGGVNSGGLMLDFTGGVLPPAFTCTRVNASAGATTRWDANGTLVDVPNNVAAFSYTPLDNFAVCGVLAERAGTNLVINTNSPQTQIVNESLRGVTATQVGTGTEDGMPYVDVRFTGTATSTGRVILRTASINVGGSVGTIVSGSSFMKIVSGTPMAGNFYNTITEATGGFPTSFAFNTLSKTETKLSKNRSLVTRTTTVSTAVVQLRFEWDCINGTAYDFTIRYAHPQLEVGNWPTMPIRTSGTTVTRVADLNTAPPSALGITSFKNVSFLAEYMMFGTVSASTTTSQSETQRVVTLSAGSNNQAGLTARTRGGLSEVLKGASSLSGGATASSMFFQHDADATVGQVLKIAARFKDGDCAMACTGNASIVKPATFTQTATTPTELCLGGRSSLDLTQNLSGIVRRIFIAPATNWSDTDLLLKVNS